MHDSQSQSVTIGYQRFWKRAAAKVSTEWGHYVGRIVCTDTITVFDSRTRSDAEAGMVVDAADTGIWDEYWKHV